MDPDVAETIAYARRIHGAMPAGSTDLMFLVMHTSPGDLEQALGVPEIRQSINEQNTDGMTALMYAAQNGKGDNIGILKQHGANLGLTNSAGKTARDLLPEDLEPDVQAYIQNMLGGRRRRRKTRARRKTRKTRKSRK
jgi:hypothetical protein